MDTQAPQQATQAKQVTQATEAWISLKEAAARLDRSTKRVSAMASDGTLKSRKVLDPDLKQQVLVVHQGDVERVLWLRDHPEERPKPAAQPAKPLLALPAAQPEQPDEEPEFELPKNENPWLTLDEAARYTRLPKAYLRKLATVGELATRNVGIKEVRVRVSRRALDQL